MSLRHPVVAGSFYPGSRDALRRAVADMVPNAPRRKAHAVVVPHAGYVYSGKVAGAVYGRVELPRDVVILALNHRAAGSDFAVWPSGAWRTPLGDAEINEDLAQSVKEAFPPAQLDEAGHAAEHSAEVQVPFLQHLRPDVKIVPVALSVGLDDASFEKLCDFGRALAGVPGDFLVAASTDLNHFEDQETTLRKDEAVIREIERLDEKGLRDAIRSHSVSMCGYAPVLAAVAFARARGAVSARTVMHETSAGVSGDTSSVVGYVGMIVPCGN